jgi:Protein of unknown function (DUF4254)
LQFSSVEVALLHDRSIELWHSDDTKNVRVSHSFYDTVLAQHHANFDLWHTEDRARIPHASDHDIAEVKPAIDRLNQRRNELAEQCDTLLLDALRPSNQPNRNVELNFESPKLRIDRPSILLSRSATQERKSTGQEHPPATPIATASDSLAHRAARRSRGLPWQAMIGCSRGGPPVQNPLPPLDVQRSYPASVDLRRPILSVVILSRPRNRSEFCLSLLPRACRS